MTNDFNKRLRAVYAKQLNKFGPESPHSVAWNSERSQNTRFQILSQIAALENQIILDVGSGLGDFGSFLKPLHVFYTGIEISSELVEACKIKYPDLRIICGDFITYEFNTQYDYVLCSGALNTKSPDHKQYVYTAIKKMFDLARKGIAFNLPSNLSELAKNNEPFDKELQIEIAYMDPSNVFNYCKSLSKWVTLRHDYLPHDFTIYMYK